ncbi:MAG: hypothetical protein QG657_5540, partial [Acidobacteriota bacterium]|nr:hypothetical protein [Acidobacteriota bacterium]
MIPGYFVNLAKMPLTPNGKLDRKALPEPVKKAGEGFIGPRDSLEENLTEIWSGILGIDKDFISMDASFFELGGHSLKANVLISKIYKELNAIIPLTAIFLKPRLMDIAEHIRDSEKYKEFRDAIPLAEIYPMPRVIELAGQLKDTARQEFAFIEPVEKKEYYALSSAQARLYVMQHMDPASTAYNLPVILKLEGEVHEEKLENSFRGLIKRHESLRTSFETIDDEPVQRVHDNVEFEIEYKDLFMGEQGQTRPFGGEGQLSFIRPFDLSKAPLMRVGLVRIEENKYELVVDMHHIITDGVSMGVLVKEFISLYKGESLLLLRLQYKDYSEWQKREIVEQKGESILRQEAYWLKEFEIETPVLDLPIDYPKPKVQGFEGRGERFIVDDKDAQALRVFAREKGATLYMLLLSIYNIFLARITHQEMIVVGTPTAGRVHSDLEGIIGMFVNTLALKNEPAGEKTIGEFLIEVREKTLQAFANQEYQYEDLVKRTAASRDMGRNPLFDTMFVYQDLDISKVEIPGLKATPHEYERDTSKFDLTLEC